MAIAPYIFQDTFGDSWEKLPPVLKNRYSIRADGGNTVTVEGLLDVAGSSLSRTLMPLLRIFGALVPYEGRSVPVTVQFTAKDGMLAFERTFHFPGKPPYYFRSKIQPRTPPETIEFMRFGIGWRGDYIFDGNKILIKHRGYALKLAGLLIPLPLSLLLGKGYGEEWAEGSDTFGMLVEITHPLWGRVFRYNGSFRVLPA